MKNRTVLGSILNRTFAGNWFPSFIVPALTVLLCSNVCQAQNADSMMRLLKSGRIPAARQGNLVDAICKRGNESDLAYILEQAVSDDGFGEDVQLIALQGLAEAAQGRNVVPDADPELLVPLLQSENSALQKSAVTLAAIWGDPVFVTPLIEISEDSEYRAALRRDALRALASSGLTEAQSALQTWLGADNQEPNLAVTAAAGLIQANMDEFAPQVVDWLVAQPEEVDTAKAIQAFLQQQGGAGTLGGLLADKEIDTDRAKRFLRAAYAIGRSDPELIDVLTAKGGLDKEPAELTPEMMQRLVGRVRSEGDPERGELIFRRQDLTCFNCHALSGAGGKIGPDLSAIGASSPEDYLINAIVKPEQDVKEVYQMQRVLTIDGQLVSGVKVTEDENKLVLRDASGEEHIIPQDDIEDSVEGGSLMPKGLKVLMTEGEFVDLIAFLAELGKPGPYAVRMTPTIQRWKVTGGDELGVTRNQLIDGTGIKEVLASELESIPSLYAKVAGNLPWREVRQLVEDDWVVLVAEINVVVGGEITFDWQGPRPEGVWLDEDRWVDISQPQTVAEGTHRLVVLLPIEQEEGTEVRGEIQEPDGSRVDFNVTGGT